MKSNQTAVGYATPNGSTASYFYQVKDWLGSPHITLNAAGVIQNATDYYPYGKPMPGRSQYGTNYEGYRYQFTGHERDGETNYQYHGARYYDEDLARYMSVDRFAMKFFHQSPYVYAGDNPISFIDFNGDYPWPVHIRSFISKETVGAVPFYGHAFRGDGRSVSTNIDKSTTSRVRTTFNVDPSNGTITDRKTVSDKSVYTGGWIPGSSVYLSPSIKTGSPTSTIENEEKSKGTIIFDFSHSGQDPITPNPLTPSLDVHAILGFKEDLDKGILTVKGMFAGDKFPSTEAFILDQSGNAVFLGAKKEEGGLSDLFGDNKLDLFKVDMQIKFDDKGNFTGVLQGKENYTVEQWNTKIEESFK